VSSLVRNLKYDKNDVSSEDDHCVQVENPYSIKEIEAMLNVENMVSRAGGRCVGIWSVLSN